MKATHVAPVIHVSDLERSIGFYTDVLGFSIDFKLPTYAGVVKDQIILYLSGPGNQGLKRAIGQAHVCIDCDEIDEYHALIASKGVAVIVTPDNRFYGARDFAITDPDGNILIFSKPLDDHQE